MTVSNLLFMTVKQTWLTEDKSYFDERIIKKHRDFFVNIIEEV